MHSAIHRLNRLQQIAPLVLRVVLGAANRCRVPSSTWRCWPA